MEGIERILWWINKKIKSVKFHSKDKRNTEINIAFYEGYEAALKEMKKKIKRIKEEEYGCIDDCN